MRIDQWLCNARFFKSRGLAQTAVDSGRVKVNGERSKSSVMLAVGDVLNIQIGEYSWDVKVLSVTEYAHGFVPEPHELYEEDEDSLARRAQSMEAKKLQLKNIPTNRPRTSAGKLRPMRISPTGIAPAPVTPIKARPSRIMGKDAAAAQRQFAAP